MTPDLSKASYERHAARTAERQRAQTRAAQDIAPALPVADYDRRLAAETEFRFFCDQYFPDLFPLAWSDDHLKVIARIQAAMTRGGKFATAMPRGSGKTTLCEVAAIWGAMTGKHPFIMLIGASAGHADNSLQNIKAQLLGNELLYEDFPAELLPFRSLEGEARRAAGQHYYGAKTYVKWTVDELVFGQVPGSLASGAIIRVAGITGAIRGANFTRPDGAKVRPTLAILDDLQTDESAKSPSQVADRLKTIAGAVTGLAGPDTPTAILMPCTVICEGDVADQLLDPEKHPDWQSERTKLVYSFPTDHKHWEQYFLLRDQSLREHGDNRLGNAYYEENREAMDAGASVAWAQRFRQGEISAIQHAMNLRHDDEAAFYAEYQNEPMRLADYEEGLVPEAAALMNKQAGHPRGRIPPDYPTLTAFVDVQGKLLYWLVAAWREGFGGAIIDYGAFPDQHQHYFTLRTARRTLARARPGVGADAALYWGLQTLTDRLLGRTWLGMDGSEHRIARCLIDAGWGETKHLVYRLGRESSHRTVLSPSFGRGVKASDNPMSDWNKKSGEVIGLDWRHRHSPAERVRYVLYDANAWKTRAMRGLSAALAEPHGIELFKVQSAAIHRMFADHATAESPIRTEGRGRSVVEWKLGPSRPDNHLLDCIVGAMVAASMAGMRLAEQSEQPRRKRYTRKDLQRATRRRRSKAIPRH